MKTKQQQDGRLWWKHVNLLRFSDVNETLAALRIIYMAQITFLDLHVTWLRTLYVTPSAAVKCRLPWRMDTLHFIIIMINVYIFYFIYV